MWTIAAITIAGILAALLLGLSGWAWSFGHKNLAAQYFYGFIGFSLVGIFLAITAAARKSNQPTEPPNSTNDLQDSLRDKKFKFGVYWDAELNSYCPVCRTPLTLSIKNLVYQIDIVNNTIPPPPPVPHCLKCNDVITLYDDEGNRLTLSEAKWLLSPIKRKADIESPKTNPPKPQKPQTADAETIKLRDAREKLRTIRKQMPIGVIGLKYIYTYHQALNEIQRDTGRDMSHFIVPLDEIQSRTGETGETEQYCDRAIFFIIIDNTVNFLKGDPADRDSL